MLSMRRAAQRSQLDTRQAAFEAQTRRTLADSFTNLDVSLPRVR